MHQTRVAVLGAGPAGTIMAILLARRGMRVQLFERRGDIRAADHSEGWSRSVIISKRGMVALEKIGVAKRIPSISLPLVGRTMHGSDGTTTTQPYGRDGETMFAVLRHELLCILLDAAEAEEGVEFCFDHSCIDLDVESSAALFTHDGETKRVEADLIVAADGARSVARKQLLDTPRYDYSQEFLPIGYKEVVIPASEGQALFDPQHLHVWPRHDFVMVGVPSRDGTLTCSLFLPYEGELGFSTLDDEEKMRGFLDEHFADVAEVLGPLSANLVEAPPRPLFTVKCNPFHYHQTVLIGDAAHAIVPFFGQGLNCALEDCTFLDRLVEKCGNDWGKTLSTFSRRRKQDTDALAELALDNFRELSSLVAKKSFLWRQKLERTLHRMMPEHFIPLYLMVNFSTIPYAEVQKRARRQEEWLLEVLTG